MSRNVCISAIGPSPFPWDTGDDHLATAKQAIAHLDRWMDRVLPDRPDLIVMPEACDRPAVMDRFVAKEYFRERGNLVLDHCREVAKREGVNIAYSSKLPGPDGWLRNCTSFIDRSGDIRGVYCKNHLVWDEYEDMGIKFGKDAPVIDMDFGRVAGAICFDLNFDELRLKYVQSRPELIVFSSMYHGGLTQRLWANSCQSYFVGAVAGQPCTVIDPLGDVVAQSTNYFPTVTHTVNLDYALAHLDCNWEKLDALKEKYGRGVHVKDPGFLGYVLITSQTEGVSAMDMVAEFEIELFDDYMRRSLEHRHAPGHMEE